MLRRGRKSPRTAYTALLSGPIINKLIRIFITCFFLPSPLPFIFNWDVSCYEKVIKLIQSAIYAKFVFKQEGRLLKHITDVWGSTRNQNLTDLFYFMLHWRSVNPNNVNDIMNREAVADAGYKEPSPQLVLT